jgi:hypothetical protein
MTPEEAGVYGVSSVVRSTAGGPSLGLRKRAKKKHPRPPAETEAGGVISKENLTGDSPEALADNTKGRTFETENLRKKFKKKTENRRLY